MQPVRHVLLEVIILQLAEPHEFAWRRELSGNLYVHFKTVSCAYTEWSKSKLTGK
jgi:hypothetical protein